MNITKHAFILFLICFTIGVKANVYFVTNTASSGPGSLDYAVQAANGNAGPDTVVFNITGTPPFKIQSAGTLNVSDPLFIDGTTQPGYNFTTYDPIIELDGNLVGVSTDGIFLYDNSHLRGLIINRFTRHGVFIAGKQNVIENCWIGTDSTGTVPRGNAFCGIYVNYGSSNIIGGATPADRNVISGSVGANMAGIYLQGNGAGTPPNHNIIMGNYIGTDKTGMVAIPNFSGVTVYYSNNDQIGTSSAGNVISGNANAAIYLESADSALVQNNILGLDAAGVDSLPNPYGVELFRSSYCTIGGVNASEKNIISGNTQDGIYFYDSDTNYVAGNYIGLLPDGNTVKSNKYANIYFDGSRFNIIGGNTSAHRNIIAGGVNSDISLNNYSHNNIISGNYIGTDTSGTVGLSPNSSITITFSHYNLIGGSTPGERNIIGGHPNGYGVLLEDSALYNVVKGNYIGTDVSGTMPLPNQTGVATMYSASFNQIGGTAPGEGNVISGNVITGYRANAYGAGNSFLGNYVGTDYSGTVALSNGSFGVELNSKHNQIGGESPGEGNLISGNVQTGVYINNDSNSVFNNYIGTDVTGNNPLGNGSQGIEVYRGIYVLIGKGVPSTGNTIAYNGMNGVMIDGTDTAATTVGVLYNTIHDNGQLGIEILDANNLQGPDSNDSLDADAGSNKGQNYPIIGCISYDGTNTLIDVKLNSGPNRTYFIELVKNDMPDASGYGEGMYLEAHQFIHTDAGGNAATTISLPGDYTNYYFSATATDSLNVVTSEYGPATTILGTTLTANNVTCHGAADGNAVVHSFGGMGMCTYSWNTGATTDSIYGLAPGLYIATTTCANGCVKVDSIQIFEPAPVIVNAGLDTTVCSGTAATISGSGATTYSWTDGSSFVSNSIQFDVYPAVNTNYILYGTDPGGCIGTDTVLISVNPAPAPGFTAPSVCYGSPSLFTNNSAISSGTIVSVNWDFGDGTNSTAFNPSHTYNSSGTFNVVLVATSDLACTDTMVQSIQVHALPVANAGTDQNVCSGDSITITGTSSTGLFDWTEMGGANISYTSSMTVAPAIATSYVLTVSDAGTGCYSSDTVLVTPVSTDVAGFSYSSSQYCNSGANELPTITGVTGGSFTEPTGQGVFPLNMTTGEISPSNAIAGTYTITYTTNGVCPAAPTATITIIPKPLIQGTITYDSLGTIVPLLSGQVTLFSVDANDSILSAVTQNVTAGSYSFNNFYLSGKYVVLSSPDSATYYPNVVSQYHSSQTVWDSVVAIAANCGDTLILNVQHKYLPDNLGGAGVISGYVYKPFGRRPGEPVIGVDVSIDQVPGGMQAMRTTDTTGYYEFNNIPDGTYILLVNIPGKEMDSTYTVNINSSTGNIVDTNKIFFVDSVSIFISDSIVIATGFSKVFKSVSANNWLSIYPNPTSSSAMLRVETVENDIVRIEILTGTGLLLCSLREENVNVGNYFWAFDKDRLNLPAGAYYIRVSTNEHIQTIKVIVNK